MSGLYYTKSEPSEPSVYRGRGSGAFLDWTLGDPVWCDGVPTGCLVIHHALLKAMWDESKEYVVSGYTTRRVFESANRSWVDPETGRINTTACTSDLDWCWRAIKDDYFRKAGWDDYADREFSFLIDTNIHCLHVTPDGVRYPPQAISEHVEEPPVLGVSVSEETQTAESMS